VRDSAPAPNKRPGGPERLLLEEDYFSLMLFGLLNPVISSMRGLCAASRLKRVQHEVCGKKVSLGSFSEAQGVFDPELLKQVFLDRSSEVPVSWGDARLAHLADTLKLVDGTLLPALIYRYRWQIELFFKWLKSILGCRHLMAESPAGVAIQIYSALIAALMLQLLTGKRPGKRAMELILFYLMGHAELDELVALLGLEKSAR
jgi:hypothetical protein